METLEEFYSQILDLDFLIEYGYYDRNVKSELNKNNIDTDRISDGESEVDQFYSVGDNFFPEYFSTKGLLLFLQSENLDATIDDNRNISYGANNILGGRNNHDTDPIIFTIPKSNDLSIRRTYKIPNIYSYVRLALYINLNSDYFIDLFTNNKQSTSKYFNHFHIGNFKTTDKLSTKLLAYGNHILNLDLSNFYPTLYTHSLAWVDLGKQIAKNNYHDGIGNNLDKLVRAEQYGETHGVPTGNFLTRIIAEYFLCKIDKELEDLGYIYTRYVDDLKFPYNDEEIKDEFLSQVHIKSNEYNITLNEQKTSIETHPTKNKLNKAPIFSFFDNFSSNKYLKWIDKLYDYINLCLDEESKGNKGSIKVLYTSSLFNLKGNSNINQIFTYKNPLNNYNLFKHFLDISLKDSKLANRFLNFTKNLVSKGVSQNGLNRLVGEYFEENHEKIKRKINMCIENKYNQEVYQLLLYYLYFKVYKTVDQTHLTELIGEDHPVDEEGLGFLIKIIDSSNDDFSIVLAITIYLQIVINEFFVEQDYANYDSYINKLFKKLNEVLSESYQSYLSEQDRVLNPYDVHDKSRMAEKLWFVRYHIYYLTNKYDSFKVSLNNYYRESETPRNRRGLYKSQLNWDFIKTNMSIDKFYERMLNQNVPLFYFDFENYTV